MEADARNFLVENFPLGEDPSGLPGDASLLEAWPFWALTFLIAALPFLTFLLFRRRAEQAMPRVRDWLATNAWLVNIFVLGLFIVMLLS